MGVVVIMIIVGVVIVFAIVSMGRVGRDEEMEAGGSYGRQLFGRKKKDDPEDR
ncbi:MAG TPA: hypothetical protein VMG74_04200 [Gaiellaceae bacterium]|nr:hypothetical protein [Gaiellaceae bacterium]